MLRVGLTGGIASGKSVVLGHWSQQGVPTCDADRLVHELFLPEGGLAPIVADAFGRDFLARDGSVDRKRLGALVFSDPSARERLNAIVHPAVWDGIAEFFRASAASGQVLAVVDAALMMETGSYRNYDRVVLVACPREIQLARLVERSRLAGKRLSEPEAAKRIDSQWPLEKKRPLAHYVIDSAGSLDETLVAADEVLGRLRLDAAN